MNPAAQRKVNAIAIDAGASMSAVACPSASQCTAVDDKGQELTFNPTAPGTPTPTAVDASSLTAIACPSVSQCTAIGASRVVTFNPTAPATVRGGSIDGSVSSFEGVACPAITLCTMVDSKGQEYTLDPTTQAATAAFVDQGHYLQAVACPSVTLCTAVGPGRETTFNPSSPSTPTVVPVNANLTAVTCPSLTQCETVDDSGDIIQSNPSDPHASIAVEQPFPDGLLLSVACSSVAQCVAIGTGAVFTGTPPPLATPAQAAAQIKASLDSLLRHHVFNLTDLRDYRYVDYPGYWCSAVGAGVITVVWYSRGRPRVIAQTKEGTSNQGIADQNNCVQVELRLTGAGKRLLKHHKRLALTAKATFRPAALPAITVTSQLALN